MTSSISRQRGTCKWFDCEKGFGFIKLCTPIDGSRDVFVHCSAIKSQGIKGLTKGENVEFDIVNQPDGRRKAINVTGPKGAFVIGPKKEDINKNKDRKVKRKVTANGNSKKRCRTQANDQLEILRIRNDRTKRLKTHHKRQSHLRPNMSGVTLQAGHTESIVVVDETKRFRWTDDFWFPKQIGVVPTVVQIAESGDLRKMMRYIAAGGDLDERQHWTEVDDHYGYYEKNREWWNLSALMQSVRKMDVEMVRLLLLNQADPMLESCYDDGENCTAKEIAEGVQNKSIEGMISVVLELWGSLNPNYKKSPLHDPGVAKNTKPDKEQIRKAIESLGPFKDQIHRKIQPAARLKMHNKRPAPRRRVNLYGFLGLGPKAVQIANSGNTEEMWTFIENGGDLDERHHWEESEDKGFYDKSWEWWHVSALMQAARNRDHKMVYLLLRNQADPMLESCYSADQYCTALDMAVIAKSESIQTMITVVLKLWKELNPNCREHASYNPERPQKEKPERGQIKRALETWMIETKVSDHSKAFLESAVFPAVPQLEIIPPTFHEK